MAINFVAFPAKGPERWPADPLNAALGVQSDCNQLNTSDFPVLPGISWHGGGDR